MLKRESPLLFLMAYLLKILPHLFSKCGSTPYKDGKKPYKCGSTTYKDGKKPYKYGSTPYKEANTFNKCGSPGYKDGEIFNRCLNQTCNVGGSIQTFYVSQPNGLGYLWKYNFYKVLNFVKVPYVSLNILMAPLTTITKMIEPITRSG